MSMPELIAVLRTPAVKLLFHSGACITYSASILPGCHGGAVEDGREEDGEELQEDGRQGTARCEPMLSPGKDT